MARVLQERPMEWRDQDGAVEEAAQGRPFPRCNISVRAAAAKGTNRLGAFLRVQVCQLHFHSLCFSI